MVSSIGRSFRLQAVRYLLKNDPAISVYILKSKAMNHFIDSELSAFKAVFVNGSYTLKECIRVFVPVFLIIAALYFLVRS